MLSLPPWRKRAGARPACRLIARAHRLAIHVELRGLHALEFVRAVCVRVVEARRLPGLLNELEGEAGDAVHQA
eukprot:12568029-Alexandrium_andersonii.AAC.1